MRLNDYIKLIAIALMYTFIVNLIKYKYGADVTLTIVNSAVCFCIGGFYADYKLNKD